jgi:hypothetical protein
LLNAFDDRAETEELLVSGGRLLVIDLTEGQQRKPLVGDGCVPWRILRCG